MGLPAFTAEYSLYNKQMDYRLTALSRRSEAGSIVPAEGLAECNKRCNWNYSRCADFCYTRPVRFQDTCLYYCGAQYDDCLYECMLINIRDHEPDFA
jgi:hypothetical protein